MYIVKDIFYLILVFFLVYVLFYFFHRHDTTMQKMQYYDCNLTEFIPNVPEDVVQECRNRKINELNRHKEIKWTSF